MQTELAKLDNSRVEITIEVGAEQVNQAVAKAAVKLAGRVNIPGFRKGKAPRAILERYIGKGALLEEAFDLLYPEAVWSALRDNSLEPIDRPEITDVESLEEGKPCRFKVVVEIVPEVQLGKYKGLEATKVVKPATEAEVDEVLANMRERGAQLAAVENGELSAGLFAVIDFEGFIDGVAFPGGAGKAVALEIGGGRFIPGFEEQLKGAKAGETREVNVTFPEDYHAKHLAGKAARFEVVVHEVKEKQLPALDDEFAKSVSDFETLDALKADIRKRIDEERAGAADREVQRDLVMQAVSGATIEVPEKLIERRVEGKLTEFAQRLAAQGFSLEDYLGDERTLDDLRKDFREDAEVEVKSRLTLESIVKAEGIRISEAEAEAKLAERVGGNTEEAAKLKANLVKDERWDSFVEQLAVDQAVQLLVESADIKVSESEAGESTGAKPKKKATRSKKAAAEVKED